MQLQAVADECPRVIVAAVEEFLNEAVRAGAECAVRCRVEIVAEQIRWIGVLPQPWLARLALDLERLGGLSRP